MSAFNTFKFFSDAITFGISVSLLFWILRVVVLGSIGEGNSVRSYPEQSTTKSSEPPSMWHTHGDGQDWSVSVGTSSFSCLFCISSSWGAGVGAVVVGSSIVPTPLPSIIVSSVSRSFSGGNWLSFSIGISSLWPATVLVLKINYEVWLKQLVIVPTICYFIVRRWRKNVVDKNYDNYKGVTIAQYIILKYYNYLLY